MAKCDKCGAPDAEHIGEGFHACVGTCSRRASFHSWHENEIARLTEQRDALLAACEAAECELERLKDIVCEEDDESICGILGILASARLRARGGDR